jgi:hypothetical protein
VVNEKQAERLASNQALFRSVNETMQDLEKRFGPRPDDRIAFVCECSHLDCVEEIAITHAEYTGVRSNPRWFVVAPSDEHVFPEIELVIKRTDRYFVLQKIDVAGEVAEQAAQL